MKVLLAEDNHLLLRMYQRVFFHAGYEVITALTGKQAFEQAKVHFPDVLVTDFMMPEMDGLTLLNAIKKDPKTAHIPVIFLTNLNTLSGINDALHNGAQAYIIKDAHHPQNVLKIVRHLTTAK